MMRMRDQLDPGHTLDFGVTVDQGVSFIVDALEDPLNPRWCGPSLMGCVIVIQFYHSSADSLAKSNHAFGSTLVAFFTVKRSTTDMEELDSHWGTCRCSPAAIRANSVAAQLHYLAAGFAPVIAEIVSDRTDDTEVVGRFGDRVDIIGTLVDRLVGFLADALSKVKPMSVAQGRRPDIWPATPKDLTPYGPETTVESLVTWARFLRSAHAFALLSSFMRVCGPLVVPAIVKSGSVAKYMTEHGLQICANASSASLTRNGQLDDAAAEKFGMELSYLGFFMSSLRSLPPLLNRDFHFGHATSAFDFASKAISITESSTILRALPDIERVREVVTTYAAVLYTLMPEQMTVPKARVHPAILSVVNHIFTPSPPALSAWEMIRSARQVHYCFAPGCPESAQSSGPVYQRCGGCRVVAYSSKACQTRAWADPRLPHKSICKKMRRVSDAGGSSLQQDNGQDNFVLDMRRANIDDSTLKEIGTWLSAAYMLFQREGPFLTPAVREHLSQREGPLYPEGVDEYLSTRTAEFDDMIGLLANSGLNQ